MFEAYFAEDPREIFGRRAAGVVLDMVNWSGIWSSVSIAYLVSLASVLLSCSCRYRNHAVAIQLGVYGGARG